MAKAQKRDIDNDGRARFWLYQLETAIQNAIAFFGAFQSVKAFGAKGTGTVDDAPSWHAGFVTTSAGGETLWSPTGTYEFATAFVTPSNSLLRGAPTAQIDQQLTPASGAALSQGAFYASYTARAGAPAGTLNGAPTLYQAVQTISAALATRPQVGNYALLLATGGSTGGLAVYKITAVAGGASPWTLTLDRPVVWPFSNGDTVLELSAVPIEITIDGQGLVVGGTGDDVVEMAYARNVAIANLHYDATLGFGTLGNVAHQSPYVGGLDVGTISSLVDNCHVNLSGAAYCGGGWQMQSNERSIFRRLRVANVQLATGTGIFMLDSYSCGIEDCWTYGGAANTYGMQLASLNANFPGNLDCWIDGGGTVGTYVGLLIQSSSNTLVRGWSATGCTTTGVQVTTSASKTRFESCSATNCGQAGFATGASCSDVSFQDVDASHNLGGAGHIATGCIDAANTGLTTIDGLTIDLAAGEGLAGVFTHGSNVLHARAARISMANAGYGFLLNGTRADISDSVISNTAGAGTPIPIYIQSGVASVRNTTISISGGVGYGIYVSAGCTLYLDESSNLSGCATPVNVAVGGYFNRTSIVAAGTGAAQATAFPDLQANARILTEHTVVGGTATAATPVIVQTPGVGWTSTFAATDTGTYTQVVR